MPFFFRKNIVYILAILGLADSLYLTYKHYYSPVEICFTSVFADCGRVLKSSYSEFYGIPLAVFGILYYLSVFYVFFLVSFLGTRIFSRLLFVITLTGVLFSIYFTYLQFFIINAICPYCLFSALNSVALYFTVRAINHREYRIFILDKIYFFYQIFIKPILFLFSADAVHNLASIVAFNLNKVPIVLNFISRFFITDIALLKNKILGINFYNPIGLSAGYDYNGYFASSLSSFGFGFSTVGTVTFRPCAGNKKPQLQRLKKSYSILVNKGFKNQGAKKVILNLSKCKDNIPLGVSIGRTNDDLTKNIPEAVEDIIFAFKMFSDSNLKISFYELNISCPNLKEGADFYVTQNLEKLLKNLTGIYKDTAPIFVKMPISLNNEKILKILNLLGEYEIIKGVIFGNLQKNRDFNLFDSEELKVAGAGNFSGKPTFRRSNELIRMAYKLFGKRFVIIGCGGVTSGYEAYTKIKNGASLIQLITGMIYEGPQLVSKINYELEELLKKDGFRNIDEAIGADVF